MTRWLGGAVLTAIALGPVPALAVTPVTVTILRFQQGQDPDPVAVVDAIDAPDTIGHGDFYARVRIGDHPFERNRGSFIESADFQPMARPEWRFTRVIDADDGTIPVVIQMWDADPIENNDDIIDLNEQDDAQAIVLNLDLASCTWTGDAGVNGSRTRGDGDHEHFGAAEGGERGTLLFDVACSQIGDLDGDGIPDGVERFGIRDVEGDLAFDLQDPDLAVRADPCRKTVLVEIDSMAGNAPNQDALDIVVEAFDTAPLAAVTPPCPYPDFAPAQPGIGLVAVRSDTDLPAEETAGLDDVARLKAEFFAPALAPYFHYGVWIQQSALLPLVGQCCSGNRGQDFYVVEADVGGAPRRQAVRFMHELGHALGLQHSGLDNIDRDAEGNRVSRNCKPNYLSIMNYAFVTGLVDLDTGDIRVDYSGRELDPLRESALDENAGIGDGSLETCWAPTPRDTLCGRGDGPLDFDDDGELGTATVDLTVQDIFECGFEWEDADDDGMIDEDEKEELENPGDRLNGLHDWQLLSFKGARLAGGVVLGAVEELPLQEVEKIERRLQARLRCSPPEGGTWTVDRDCTIWRDVAAPADLVVTAETVLTIGAGATLDVDFAAHALRVEPGARVEVQPDGRIE
jgi:hypothetical protein